MPSLQVGGAAAKTRADWRRRPDRRPLHRSGVRSLPATLRHHHVSTCLRGDFSAAHLTGVKKFAGFLTDPYTALEPPTIAWWRRRWLCGRGKAVNCSHADDRPHGLLQATVTRDDAGDPGPAWDGQVGWFGRW